MALDAINQASSLFMPYDHVKFIQYNMIEGIQASELCDWLYHAVVSHL